jgi:hypothetical protein
MKEHLTRGKADYIWGLIRNQLSNHVIGSVNINQRGAAIYDVDFTVYYLDKSVTTILDAISLILGVYWVAQPIDVSHIKVTVSG